jgi:ankyrin repeat protein
MPHLASDSKFLAKSRRLQQHKADIDATRNNQLEQDLLSKRQQTQLNARLSYLKERLIRIKTNLETYSQSSHTYVASNWAYEDDSMITKNLNGYISGASNFLANASAKPGARPRANTIASVTNPTRPGFLINPDSGDLLSSQGSLIDSWIRLPETAASGSQRVLPEPLSPMVMLPSVTSHGFLQNDDEHETEFEQADSALKSRQVSLSNDPSLESATSSIHPSPDTTLGKSSTVWTTAKKRSEGDPQHGRELSHHESEAITSRFTSIGRLCASNSQERAAFEAIEFLKSYTPSSATIPHVSEIRDNIINSGKLGLAGTGHGYAPLHFFISLPTEYAFEVSLLIDHGADVNAIILPQAPDSCFRPPCHNALQLAAERGHAKITALLASSPSIDLETPYSCGLTPLFIAWRKGHLDVVSTLLTHGALSAGSPFIWQGNSLLHGAAWLCQPQLVLLLLALGANVNAQNAAGSTPLIAAVISNDIANARLRKNKVANCVPVMKMLLDAGAKFRIRNKAGHTAMYYAERERNLEAVALLEGRGAKRAIVEAHPLHPHDVVVNLVKRALSSPTRPQIGDLQRSRTMSA